MCLYAIRCVPTLLFVVAFLYNYNVALHAQNHERCGVCIIGKAQKTKQNQTEQKEKESVHESEQAPQ